MTLSPCITRHAQQECLQGLHGYVKLQSPWLHACTQPFYRVCCHGTGEYCDCANGKCLPGACSCLLMEMAAAEGLKDIVCSIQRDMAAYFTSRQEVAGCKVRPRNTLLRPQDSLGRRSLLYCGGTVAGLKQQHLIAACSACPTPA